MCFSVSMEIFLLDYFVEIESFAWPDIELKLILWK